MLALFLAIAAAVASAITAPGPEGPLAGTLVDAGPDAPVVLIIPGSGPTDRDGNNPMGVTSASYRLLAQALADKGVSSVRIDKRGMFGSKSAVRDANAVTIADYADDTHEWVQAIRDRTGARCVWLLGHSEGGLVALSAAQRPNGICGIVLVAVPGRKLGVIMREQLKANPANAPLLNSALAALDSLEAGRTVDVAGMHTALQQLFAPQVQPFLIDLLAQDPSYLAAQTSLPLMIVQGGGDIQVAEADFQALKGARPNAQSLLIPTMSHVLKTVDGEGRAASIATYSDPSRPVSGELVDAIAAFVAGPAGERG
jgi:pimeloyl-ACP methyl ester carboxylesterase